MYRLPRKVYIMLRYRTLNTSTVRRSTDYTYAVIGGGVIGLAIARQLVSRKATYDKTSTLLIERNNAVGLETSSRNSEVIHAGLYYGPSSLKTHLCIRGKRLLYAMCSQNSIPYAKLGKWIVAQTEQQYEELVKLHQFSHTVEGVPTEFVSQERAKHEEPLICARAGVLESPSTGIIDSRAYMQYLLGDFQEKGGDLALYTSVTSIEALGGKKGSQGWAITTHDMRSGEVSTVSSEMIINSAGLGACDISNMILSPNNHRQQFYAKGNYFSCTQSRHYCNRLIYPAPEPGLGGLGTHLTLDMAGRMRFGPDVEWIDSPADIDVNASRLPQVIDQVIRFLPSLDTTTLVADYAGIRPKLSNDAAVGGDKNFVDFYVKKEHDFEGFVNLMGIESPGLTSSLAIAERVEELLWS